MATFAIDLLTGKEYIFNGNFNGSGGTGTSGITAAGNGLTKSGNLVRLGGTLTQNTVFDGTVAKFNLRYNGDYSTNFTNRSLVDKGYVDLRISANTPTWLTLSNIPAWLTGVTLSSFEAGHKHSQYLTGVTWTIITGKPAWLTGATLSAFEAGHKHSQYLTGVTWTIVSGKPAWLTGTTLQQFQTGHTHSYTNLSNKPSFIGSGGTIVTTVGSNVIIYSVTPSGTTVLWADVLNKPSWLSGATLQAFQTGHTHSYNRLNDKLSGGTGIAIINNVISVTGTTTDTGLQLIDISGGTEINTILSTPIIWTTIEFTGTSLSFTGGSRIYVTDNGTYGIGYALSYNSIGAGTKNIGTTIRKNGLIDIQPLTTSSFPIDSTTIDGTNLMPMYKVNLSGGDYIELLAYRTGDTGSVQTIAGASWITVLKENN